MVQFLCAALDRLLAFWPYIATLLNVLFSLLASGHPIRLRDGVASLLAPANCTCLLSPVRSVELP
jgi:hypothetical protein